MNKRAAKPGNLQKDLAELTDLLKRTQADFDNYRRRSDEQKVELLEYARAEVIRDFLPVIDNCERLLQHIFATSKNRPWKRGVEAIGKQIAKTLQDMGVERIRTTGEHFDPHLHEAVSAEGEGNHETVTEELQPGYKLGDEVIRPAIVKVTRGKLK